eukprot:Partr_v1_DN27232_c2_g1_i1_m38729 putative Inherit from NOG: hedgehog protein
MRHPANSNRIRGAIDTERIEHNRHLGPHQFQRPRLDKGAVGVDRRSVRVQRFHHFLQAKTFRSGVCHVVDTYFANDIHMKLFLLLVAVISASILSDLSLSQLVSVSYSLIDGSPSTGAASYPSGLQVANADNTPGGRAFHKITVYQNLIYTFLGAPLPRNDVWAFNLTDESWSWMAGNSTSQYPTHGIRGVSSISNTPGYRNGFGGDINRARSEFILYGGYSGISFFSWGDMWTFNLASNIWTWIAGASSLSNQVGLRFALYSADVLMIRKGSRVFYYRSINKFYKSRRSVRPGLFF